MRQTRMRELTEADVELLRWGDADFYGFYWDDSFDDPTLVLRLAPANSETLELICHWAVGLNLDVDYKNQINSLLTWDVVFEPMVERRWRIFVDLASHGSIEFECLALSIRTLAPLSAA